jgi:TrmH family RNA methyltransferase
MSEDFITSKENSLYKILKKISSSKGFRSEVGQTLLDGVHLIESYQHSDQPLILIRDENTHSSEIERLVKASNHVKCFTLSHELFVRLSDLKSTTGILALVSIPKREYKAVPLILLLDRIQDPGNLGSILRTARATNVGSVILSKGCADLWSPKTLRGSQGVQFKLNCLVEQDLAEWINHFDGEVIALTMNGNSLYQTRLKENMAIILGNEGAGIDPLLLKKTSQILSLPMQGGVESINVSAAASVFMYEFYRQFKA